MFTEGNVYSFHLAKPGCVCFLIVLLCAAMYIRQDTSVVIFQEKKNKKYTLGKDVIAVVGFHEIHAQTSHHEPLNYLMNFMCNR